MSIDFHALSGAYAVDALDAAERAAFERYVVGCASCHHEVSSLQETAGTLSAVVETRPPVRLRSSVLKAITEVRPRPPLLRAPQVGRVRRRWAAGSLVLAASAVSAVTVSHPWTSSPVTVSVASRVTSAADVQVVHSAVAAGGSLTWYRSPSVDRAVVIARGLTPLPASQVYELWLQGPDRSMVPAGFVTDGGTAVVLNGETRTALGAGMTVEPVEGSARPTTVPLAWVSFPGT